MKKDFNPITGPPSFPGANFQQMAIIKLLLGLLFKNYEISSKISKYIIIKYLIFNNLMKKKKNFYNQNWSGYSIINIIYLKVIGFLARRIIILQYFIYIYKIVLNIFFFNYLFFSF